MPIRSAWMALIVVGSVHAAEPAGFPDATHRGGRMTHIDGVPVVLVTGKPAEIGEQFGVLAVKNAPALEKLRKQFLKDLKLEDQDFFLKLMARRLKAGIPEDYVCELEAIAAASGQSLDDCLFANTVYDLSSGMGCSTLVVEPSRSAETGPLFGRNFDWIPTAGITEHTLVAVFRPEGKHAFATVTITPITGCISGMNDAGLAITLNEVLLKRSGDKSTFNWDGTPTMLAYRRVLEECTTVEEAETLLRNLKRTTAACMTLCDRSGGAVIELTPKTVELRRGSQGITCCTNHFQCEGLTTEKDCWRLTKLTAVRGGEKKLGVDDVFAGLSTVQQGKKTLQSMVFEPTRLKLHLKYGDGPATRKKPVTLDLKKLFEGGQDDANDPN